MRIDQLALLFAVVVAANLMLLVALELPRFGRRAGRKGPGQTDAGDGPDGSGDGQFGSADVAQRAAAMHAADGHALPAVLYQRIVRVVSSMFIGAVLIVASLTNGAAQASVYVLLAAGAVLIVLFQDLLRTGAPGRWRMVLEAISVTFFLTLLLMLTGGHESPYFFGFILLVGGAALWSPGRGPALLSVFASSAYVVAVVMTDGAPLSPVAIGQVAFNLAALALITYAGAVIGREQRRARDEALRLSRYDALTGLYSRVYFTAAVEQEIRRAARTGRPFGLLMVDLDGLKAANDRFGHDAGDLLLRAVADVLRGDIRVTDVAARHGGDEFVLLLPETDLTGAALVADKVRIDIARLALPHGHAVIRTSASIGLVSYPEDGRSSAELMRRADLAMYEAKRRGRDQIVRFERHAPVPMAPPTTPARAAAPIAGAPSPVAGAPSTRPTSAAAGRAPAPAIPEPSPGPAPWETAAR